MRTPATQRGYKSQSNIGEKAYLLLGGSLEKNVKEKGKRVA